MMFELNY
ncbi:RAB9, member RAS oncogene family, isoform CRA_c [Rattus norvegicus]|nr:RAB9, member RAS oncogene family, isoform CRA_c [Rattus norvegicus]